MDRWTDNLFFPSLEQPENMLMGSDGRLRLTDFSTAMQRGAPCADKFVGSAQYLSPEVLEGREPTEKVDYFGVGCVAYYLWQGRDLFLRDTDYLTWKAVLEEVPTLDDVPEVPGDAWMRRLVLQSTRRDPAERQLELPAE